jgi:[protein-PII] uridylyltransferase
MGVLSPTDERSLRRAVEFMLRLRNEMHFHAGRASDVLYRAEQLRIAELWKYPESPGVLPVEAFMRDYFSHTSRIRDTVEYFRACSEKFSAMKRAIDPLFTHRRDGHFRVGPWHIGVSRKARVLLKDNLGEVLRLMDLANQTDSLIEHSTWQAIRSDMLGRNDCEVTEEAARRFVSLLAFTPRLGNLLRRLHELGALEKLVTGMDHARCLLQFNNYHKYTVDEHCLRAVERAIDFLHDPGTLGEVYRQLPDRSAMHLALLTHDLGKGFSRDHSELGAEMALETCRRLRMSKHQTESVVFLVRHHLLMSHLAFRRDTSNEAEIVNFASQVGSPEMLKMLLVMTAADLAAVGPAVLNPWKIDVLVDLYNRTLDHLSGGRAQRGRPDVVTRREKLHFLAPSTDQNWYHRQIEALPSAYILERTPEEVLATLSELKKLPHDQALVEARYLPERKVTEYTVAINEQMVPGVFHRITGVLTSSGLQILAAQIYTLADNLILDRFQVDDRDFEGPPPASRLDAVCQLLKLTLEHPTEESPTFRRIWRSSAQQREVPLLVMPTRVVVDNNFFPEFTVIDVFAHDRIGLLYAITKTLYEQQTSVHFAKIGTYLDQVVDVFYVTGRDGKRIDDEARLEGIQLSILSAIENLHKES